jgi:hypothetical protein
MKRPHVLVGVAKINGAPAPTGTKITAWVDGYDAPLGKTDVTLGGFYSLLVEQHGSVLVSGGTSLILKIGEITTSQTVNWVEGGAHEINLEIN